MYKLKKIISDVLFVSKVTGTKNKKVLILLSVTLSQIGAFTDIALIVSFAALIGNQFTNIDAINSILDYLLEYKILLFPLIILRYFCQYFQALILKKIELSVFKNLRLYFLREVFNTRNYSPADSYFYINTLSMHISYFYNNFALLVNSFLQIFAYSVYLIISDTKTISAFGVGLLILYFPIKQLLQKGRVALDEAYNIDYSSSKEVGKVLDNLLLIKILKKESTEIKKFSHILDSYSKYALDNTRFGIINSFLPTMFTLVVLSYFLAFTPFTTKISLDFIGVTLRLFQSLGTVTKSINNVNNSHVHIEKFYELEKNKNIVNKSSFRVETSNKIILDDITFKYLNSGEPIFEKINMSINRGQHTLLTGPNGSGKSTLLGLISGIYFASAGKVSSFSDKFGYIGASPLIFEGSLYENITYGNILKIDDTKIIEYLKHLETFKEESGYKLTRTISNKSLSSGQMQKIAFVRALLSEMDVLLLDESTSNLDKDSKEKIFQLLSDKQITIINSTHIPESFQKVDSIYNIEIVDEKRVIKKV